MVERFSALYRRIGEEYDTFGFSHMEIVATTAYAAKERAILALYNMGCPGYVHFVLNSVGEKVWEREANKLPLSKTGVILP